MPLIEPDGGELINLIVPENQRSEKKSEKNWKLSHCQKWSSTNIICNGSTY